MIASLINLVIYIIILGLVIWLLTYLIDVIPVPEPFSRIARVVVIAIGILLLILVLLNFIGAVEPGMPRLVR